MLKSRSITTQFTFIFVIAFIVCVPFVVSLFMGLS